MNSRILFSFLTLFIAVTTSQAADGTNRPTAFSGYHQIVPWGVGYGMKGTVSNVTVIDDRIQFQLTGWFWFHQYPEGGTNGEQVIKVDCQRGISATVNDPDSFVAMTTDQLGGSVRNGKGKLLVLLQAAAEHGNQVRFELMNAKIDFRKDNGFTLLGADVWRVTDADLR